MQYGLCADPDMAQSAKNAGFDFLEVNLEKVLKPLGSAEEFASVRELAVNAPIVWRAANCFIPGQLKITGPDADLSPLARFVETALCRASEVNVATVVFGSQTARRVPDGFERARARGQIVEFCRMVGPVADRHGITIVVEPLNRNSCNILNTVSECADVVREVNHPSIRLLVDAYHLMSDGDSCDDVAANAHLLAHVHVATSPNRLVPGAEPCDLLPFFKALAKGGYDGRVSIEAKKTDNESDLAGALLHIKALEEAAKRSS